MGGWHSGPAQQVLARCLQASTRSPHSVPNPADRNAGTPAKPGITAVAGSDAAATAAVTFAKVFTATHYTIKLVDVNTNAETSKDITPAVDATWPLVYTFNGVGKGTYLFKVRWACNTAPTRLLHVVHVWQVGYSRQDGHRMMSALPRGQSPPQVTAFNTHGTFSEEAVSDAVVVGLPDAATQVGVTADVGRATLQWSAAQTNAYIGTR